MLSLIMLVANITVSTPQIKPRNDTKIKAKKALACVAEYNSMFRKFTLFPIFWKSIISSRTKTSISALIKNVFIDIRLDAAKAKYLFYELGD